MGVYGSGGAQKGPWDFRGPQSQDSGNLGAVWLREPLLGAQNLLLLPGPEGLKPKVSCRGCRGSWREICPSWTPGLQGVCATVAGPWLPAL